MKWGASKRDFDVALAVWPVADRSRDVWWMEELIEQSDGSVKWRDRRVPTESGHDRVDIHRDLASAKASAVALNPICAAQLAAHDIDLFAKASLQLKVRKALQAKERLQNEEALMLAEARRRNASMPRLKSSEVLLHPKSEEFREELAARLQEVPYLRAALVGFPRRAIFLGPNQEWSKPYCTSRKSAATVARAEIANGFGLSHSAHWGQTKGAIRKILLPRANQLLQLAGVQQCSPKHRRVARRYSCAATTSFGMKKTAPSDGRSRWHTQIASLKERPCGRRELSCLRIMVAW